MPTTVITGANRGIGLALARHYAQAGWRVIAAVREPAAAVALKQVAGKVDIRRLDVADDASIADFAKGLKDVPVDLLINNAGIYGKGEQGLTSSSTEDWLETFAVNSIAPLHVTAALLPNLLAGSGRKAVAITSRMGSIGDSPGGGFYAYRSSKAALNMVIANAAADLRDKKLILAVLHPGWVQTDMGGAGAPLSPEASAAGLVKAIAGLTPADSGAFFAYDGKRLPW